VRKSRIAADCRPAKLQHLREEPMPISNDVMVINEKLGEKPIRGKLIRVSEDGFYELVVELKSGAHVAYVPISSTILFNREPIPITETMEVQRF
jgi:hypothetical protein